MSSSFRPNDPSSDAGRGRCQYRVPPYLSRLKLLHWFTIAPTPIEAGVDAALLILKTIMQILDDLLNETCYQCLARWHVHNLYEACERGYHVFRVMD